MQVDTGTDDRPTENGITNYGSNRHLSFRSSDDYDEDDDNNEDDDKSPPPPPPPAGFPFGHVTSASMPAQGSRYDETSPLTNTARSSISPFFNDDSHHSSSSFTPQPSSRRQSDPTHQKRHNKRHPSSVRFRDEYNRQWSSGSNDDSASILTVDHHWLPHAYEHDYYASNHKRSYRARPRSLKRRCFLFLTELDSSLGSAIFFILLMASIFACNIIMIMQTMNHWQYTPDDCVSCGGQEVYEFEDDTSILNPLPKIPGVECVCPPTPLEWTQTTLKWLIYFFTVEWILRVVLFEPPTLIEDGSPHPNNYWRLFLAHITDAATIMDALAIFPFYLESIENTNGLMSLRLLRMFRVFQLLRLGQYNSTFWSLTNVLTQSILYLRLLVLVLVFGAALFGSLIYWLEKGSWQYHEASGMYRWMRISVDGMTMEPSPFTSIPAAFWWFMVTATTVGYGDVYPTTTPGKCVAAFAMLMGVLVVAFPVSVFTDLWAKEVEHKKEERKLQQQHHHQQQHHSRNNSDMTEVVGHLFGYGGLEQQKEQQQQVGGRDVSGASETPTTPMTPRARQAREMDRLWSSFGRLSSVQQEDDEEDEEGQSNDNQLGESSSSGLTMHQEDLDEIMSRLDDIRENETRIRKILQKYQSKS